MTRRDFFKALAGGAGYALVGKYLPVPEVATATVAAKVVGKSGLWSGAGFDSNRVALAFSNMVYGEVVRTCKKKGGLLSALAG